MTADAITTVSSVSSISTPLAHARIKPVADAPTADPAAESATNVHISQLADSVARLAKLEAEHPERVRAEASRMAHQLEELASKQSGMAAMNLRMLAERLAVAARTGRVTGATESDASGTTSGAPPGPESPPVAAKK